MRIGILQAEPAYEAARIRRGAAEGEDATGLAHDLDRLEATNRAVREVLEGDGHSTVSITVNRGLLALLDAAAPDVVFNTYFGPGRRLDQAHVASFLEYAGVPFTGSDAACHLAGLSKPVSKRLFAASGLPTPRFFVASGAAEAGQLYDASGLRSPLIVKAPGEGEGIGIDERSVVESGADVAEAVDRIVSRFGQPALVEEFLPGREFTVGVLDGSAPRVLPILEIVLGAHAAYSRRVKLGETAEEVCPAPLAGDQRELMAGLAVKAGRVLGCRDFWRVDFRMNAAGAPLILEVNTLPGLQPGYSDITKMADAEGIGYPGLLREILASFRRRQSRA
jgi:D-alanine-D-alanine ligase